jgi:hypothetical protein
MTGPARHLAQPTPAYAAYDAGGHFADELLPGERIGPPLARRRGRLLLWSLLLVLIGLGGWALSRHQAAWTAWVPDDMAAVFSSLGRWMPGRGEPAKPTTAPSTPLADVGPPIRPAPLVLSPPPPAPGRTAAADPEPVEKSAPAPVVTTAALPPARDAPEPQASPLPPPAAGPTDPYRARAEAVGLHPDLSRVLLERLSPTDYRNAGIAIQTALAETPDTAVFVWPRQRKPELALFSVRFVAGAAPGCRRYVVTVTKDGWLTTALPMEKCGVQRRAARRE